VEPFLQQQFELQLAEAAERLAERAVHRCGGSEAALAQLQSDPDGEGVWASQFVDAFFAEQLLDNPAGSCFVLQALSRRAVPHDPGGTVEQVLGRLARVAFSDVLTKQTAQLLQRALVFEG
jgi:hypothetical protein